jgi:hypothetical protein
MRTPTWYRDVIRKNGRDAATLSEHHEKHGHGAATLWKHHENTDVVPRRCGNVKMEK